MAGAGRQQPLRPSRVLGGSTEKMLRGRKDVGKDRVARIGKCWLVLTGATAESHNTHTHIDSRRLECWTAARNF